MLLQGFFLLRVRNIIILSGFIFTIMTVWLCIIPYISANCILRCIIRTRMFLHQPFLSLLQTSTLPFIFCFKIHRWMRLKIAQCNFTCSFCYAGHFPSVSRLAYVCMWKGERAFWIRHSVLMLTSTSRHCGQIYVCSSFKKKTALGSSLHPRG